MDKLQILALFDQDQRINVEYPGMQREVSPSVVRHNDTSEKGEGMVIYSHLEEANVEDVILEQVRHFSSLGHDFVWKVYGHDRPSDLKKRLRAHGFVLEETFALMVLDLSEAPEILRQPVIHMVKRIKDPEEITDILSIESQVWKEDFSSLGDYLREALVNYPDQMSVYMAFVDGKPASTAWVYFPKNSQFASLWGGASLNGYRKQGLYTSLLATRAQEAKSRRVRYITVDASPMSRPILEKFGFERITWSYYFKWKTGA